MKELEKKTRKWGALDQEQEMPDPEQRQMVLWFHDESTFYAHDH